MNCYDYYWKLHDNIHLFTNIYCPPDMLKVLWLVVWGLLR